MKKRVKYLDIASDIRREIVEKKLRQNEQIMTEEQMCRKYGVSRMTVNKAVASLVNEGFIYRVPGKGSFVRNLRVIKPIGAGRSFTEDMRAMGIEPSARLVEYTAKRASEIPDVAEKLQLSGDDLLHYFVRLRCGDGLPIGLSHTYISGKCLPAIDLSCLEGSFYEYVRARGLEIGGMTGEFTAMMPTEEQKKLLTIGDEALLLYMHVTYLTDGRPMEYIRTYYIGSRYSYSFHGGEGGGNA